MSKNKELPWSERVNAISVNPEMADTKDVYRLAGDLVAAKTEITALTAKLKASKQAQYHLGGDRDRHQKEIYRLEAKLAGWEGGVLEPLQERYATVCTENEELHIKLKAKARGRR